MLSNFFDPFFGFGDSYFLSPFAQLKKMNKALRNAVLKDLFEDSDNADSTADDKDEKDIKKKVYTRSSSITSTSNGKDMEEIRQIFTDENGETHESTSRRLGDKWHKIESHTAKDGTKTTKETWHNVDPENQNSFNLDWDKTRKSLSLEGDDHNESNKPIENKAKSEDKKKKGN